MNFQRATQITGAILFILALNHPAAAKEAPSPNIMPRPVFERDGSFSFCIADKAYPDNRKLTIAQSSKGEINLGVTIPEGGFEIGEKYDLDLIFDTAPTPRPVRATGMDDTTLLLQMGGSPTFLKTLRESKTMYVAASGAKIEFQLPDMPRLMPQLTACLTRFKGVTDEFVKATEEAMPEPLKALLLTAGFTDITPISMAKIPEAERPADFVWSLNKGSIMSGVREREIPQGKSLTEMIGLHIQGLKKKCNGTFKAEISRENATEGLKSRKVEVSCAPKIFVAMLFYITGSNRLTSFTFEAPPSEKESLLTARDQLTTTLQSLAQKTERKN